MFLRDVGNYPKTMWTQELLRAATPQQLALVRDLLVKESRRWGTCNAYMEQSCVQEAIKAFDAKQYDDGRIARYLEGRVSEIFGR